MQAQRLENFFEIHICRQPANIMVAFDHGRLAETRFYDIRIDRSLRQDIHLSDSVRFFLKDADELFPDDLPFLFRFGHTFQLF